MVCYSLDPENATNHANPEVHTFLPVHFKTHETAQPIKGMWTRKLPRLGMASFAEAPCTTVLTLALLSAGAGLTLTKLPYSEWNQSEVLGVG